MKKIIFTIGGMSCAACSSRIEKVLNKKAGIISAEVSLNTEKATVLFAICFTKYTFCKI